MAYIGKSPAVGNFIKLDAITTSATDTYNLLNGGVAYSPESVNHMLVSLNGVIQSPTTAFTVAGTQIIFASTLSSSDAIDFIMVYGDVLNLGVPSDATVTDAKITAMAASKLTGTIADARFPATLPAASGVNLTALNATNLGSGTVPTARLGTGTADGTTFLRGDQTYAAAGSDYVKLETQTVSGAVANVTFDGNFTSDYDFYRLYVTNWSGAAAAKCKIQFRASDAALTTSNYRCTGWSSYFDGTTKAFDSMKNGFWDTANANITFGDSIEETAADGGWNGTIDFYQPLNAAVKPSYQSFGYGTANGGWAQFESCGGYYNVATALSGFNLFWDGQNTDSGTFTLFGVKK